MDLCCKCASVLSMQSIRVAYVINWLADENTLHGAKEVFLGKRASRAP